MPTWNQKLLIIGASRGLGLALAQEYLQRGWEVTATVRGTNSIALHALQAGAGGRLAVETVDINTPDQVHALAEQLAGQRFDVLLVNAGARATTARPSPM